MSHDLNGNNQSINQKEFDTVTCQSIRIQYCDVSADQLVIELIRVIQKIYDF